MKCFVKNDVTALYFIITIICIVEIHNKSNCGTIKFIMLKKIKCSTVKQTKGVIQFITSLGKLNVIIMVVSENISAIPHCRFLVLST